jgi:hypothetical protein
MEVARLAYFATRERSHMRWIHRVVTTKDKVEGRSMYPRNRRGDSTERLSPATIMF